MSSVSTVVFADLSGSTSLYESMGNERAAKTVMRLTQWIADVMQAHQGRVVKMLGDGVLGIFANAHQAVAAAGELQRSHQIHLQRWPDVLRLEMHVGVASGEVLEVDGDAYGDAVNVASRLCERAGPGEIWTNDLTAVDAGILLDTIVSRSVVISLVPNSENEILQILENRLGITGSDALFYARYSNGIPGHAIALASSPWFSDLRSETVTLLFKLPQEGRTFALTEGYSWFDSNKDHITEILLIMDLVLRDMVLLLSVRGKSSLLNSDKKDNMIHILNHSKLNVSNLERAGNALTHASRSLSSNCSFESTVCQMLLSIQKELKNA